MKNSNKPAYSDNKYDIFLFEKILFTNVIKKIVIMTLAKPYNAPYHTEGSSGINNCTENNITINNPLKKDHKKIGRGNALLFILIGKCFSVNLYKERTINAGMNPIKNGRIPLSMTNNESPSISAKYRTNE